MAVLELSAVDAYARLLGIEERLRKRLNYVRLTRARGAKEQGVPYGTRLVSEASTMVLKDVYQNLRGLFLPNDLARELLHQQLRE
jgi:hypothetical protein